MSPSILTSIAAIVISTIAIAWSILSWRKVEWRIRAHENLKLMMAVEAKLSDLPSALRFHGISESEILEAGITVPEFIYLVQNFSAGQAFYEFEADQVDKAFLGDDYRATICAQPEVQKSWRLIRPFMDATPYRQRLDRTFTLYAHRTKSTRDA